LELLVLFIRFLVVAGGLSREGTRREQARQGRCIQVDLHLDKIAERNAEAAGIAGSGNMDSM
jgi:hypothetical protein